MRILTQLRGGIRLKSFKKFTTQRDVKRAVLPPRLILPLRQHIGEPAEPIVSVGDKVLKGQLIAKSTSLICAPVHASSSGTVVEIANHPVPHHSDLKSPCIVIETDGEDRWKEKRTLVQNFQDLSSSDVRNIIREAGIVGMGGAGFPTHVKLDPNTYVVDTLIINAAECEPYITCDEMLLREHALEILVGMRIMRYALQAKRVIIGIENDKRSAYVAMRDQVKKMGADFIEVVQVPTVYPTGGEKQLIQILTGKEVPSKGLPLDIGVVCHNVGTAYAVYRAVENDEPLISRYVTMAGSLASQGNLEVLLGTPVADVINQCGGNLSSLKQVIIGGPMMGMALHSVDVPVIKTTNCILVNSTVTDAPLTTRGDFTYPCIRCGQCATVCPVDLLPQQLYWHSRAKDFDKVQDYHLFDCIECGCCDYVCPSRIPLVHFYRYAKTEIWNQEQEKQKANIARERHQFHDFRLEREKAERAARHKQKRAAVSKSTDQDSKVEDNKKAAIQAAVERVRQKQEAQEPAIKNTDTLTEQQQKLIAEVDARRQQQTSISKPGGESDA